jgi:HTH-type transcriptional regulator / antitoxin HipB
MPTEFDLAEIIRYHRKQTGMTQLELANLAGVGKTVIFDIENGKNSIRFDTINKILEALNIKIQYNSPIMSHFRDAKGISYEES